METTVIDLIKTWGSLSSAILTIIAFLTLFIRPVRSFLVNTIRKNSNAQDNEKKLTEILDSIKEQAEEDKRLREEIISISQTLEMVRTGLQASLGNSVKHIYYKYLYRKKLPLQEKETIIAMHGAYKRLGGNHYVDKLVEEMMAWDTDIKEDVQH